MHSMWDPQPLKPLSPKLNSNQIPHFSLCVSGAVGHLWTSERSKLWRLVQFLRESVQNPTPALWLVGKLCCGLGAGSYTVLSCDKLVKHLTELPIQPLPFVLMRLSLSKSTVCGWYHRVGPHIHQWWAPPQRRGPELKEGEKTSSWTSARPRS